MELKLSPSILSANFGFLADNIAEAQKAGAPYLHIDVMDGIFVPQISFGMPVIKSIRPLTDMTFDVHLMITDPERYIAEFAKIGADIITFHREATKSPMRLIDLIHENQKKVGIAVCPHTPLEEIYPYLEYVDMVLIMTVEPGFGGQKYITPCNEKVRTLRAELDKRGLTNVEIEIDGGVNRETIGAALDAGANVIVAGSAVFNGSIDENVRYFNELFANRAQ